MKRKIERRMFLQICYKNRKLTSILLLIGFYLITMPGCKKKAEDSVALEYGTVTDVSGNTYTTVKIGNQWWMAEDLRTNKYRDSSSILSAPAPPDTAWKTYTSGAFTNIMNNQSIVIGRLYNWYTTVDPRGLAPAGWHIPSDEEWKVLERNLGMSSEEANKTSWRGSHEGEKLKVMRGTAGGWSDYGSIWTTNESGFSAMPYGCRMFDSSWGDPGAGYTGFWWTISPNIQQAWYRYLDYKNANICRYYGPKTYGFSVRCVKD